MSGLEARSSAAYSHQQQPYNWENFLPQNNATLLHRAELRPRTAHPRQPTQEIKAISEFTSDTEKKGDSIFDSFDPLNHATLYNRLKHLSEADRQSYFEEELVGFAGEFAGHLRYKRLTGFLRDDGELEMYGFPVMPMYKRTRDLAGPNTREDYEYQGMEKMHNAFVAHMRNQPCGNSAADWVSSSKGAKYAFIFAQRMGKQMDGGRLFVEHILEYPERQYTIESSKPIYNAVAKALGQPNNTADGFTSYKDFLQNPIMYDTKDVDDIDHLYRALGITDRDIQKSHVFQRAIKSELPLFITRYYHVIENWAKAIETFGEDHPSLQEYRTMAELIVGAFYNACREISERIDKTAVLSEYRPTFVFHAASLSSDNDSSFIAMSQQLASSRELKTNRGTNCPTTKKASSGDLPSTNDIMSQIAEGNTLNKIFSKMNGLTEDNDYMNDPNLCRCSKGGGAHFHCPGEKEVQIKQQAKDTLFVIGFSDPKKGSKKVEEPKVVIEKHKCEFAIKVGEGYTKCPSCGTAATCA